MSRWLRTLLPVIAIAMLAGTGWWWRGGSEPVGRPTAAAPSAVSGSVLRFQPGAPQLAFIRTEAAAVEPEPLIEALNGRLVYDENRTARIGAPIAGRVAGIEVQLGAQVRKGQTLATIDSPEYALALADVRRAELEVRQKRQVFERVRLLYEGEVMPRKEFEAAETDLKEAEVELSRAHKRVETLGQGSTGVGGRLALRAPLDGVVTERAISPGTLVGPDAARPLFVVSDPAHLWVIVEVPEQQLGAVDEGQAVTVEVDAYPGRTFPAKVIHVSDVLDPDTRRVQMRCAIDNPDRLLKPEMFVRATPMAKDATRRVRVPTSAIVTAGVTSYVFVEQAEGVLERRKVTISMQGRERTWLKDGLAEGERVVVSGALLLNSELSED